ncbi:hypothetical protein Pan216_13120 [Planctomycetes bacterium Pan216]|uniref:Uncharacterized protein n=1 Tax=Kolteria novifilia TaxID=2527975 RepID=A0A518B0H6_9BACT|nr:hypothetical protein Pan216_13120 [Planctomycetes bacterium Pan216]
MLPDAEVVKRQLLQLLAMKPKMAQVMEPAQHARFCEEIDAKVAKVIRGFGEIDMPDLPRAGLESPEVRAMELPADASGFLEQSRKAEEVTKVRSFLDEVAAIELQLPQGPPTRDWTQAFVETEEVAKDEPEQEEFPDWVYASLSVGLPPGMSLMESDRPKELDTSAEKPEPTDAAPSEETERKRRDQFHNFQSWVANSLSGVPERPVRGEDSQGGQWDRWLRG